jgi:hypothetical protein
VAYRLRAFHELVRNLIEGAWVRFVQRVNADKPGSATDLGTVLFGEGRAGLEAIEPSCSTCKREPASTAGIRCPGTG